jgi:hypothetical protein
VNSVNALSSKLSAVGVVILALSSSVLAFGQASGNPSVGVPEDWSHHHLVFSNPGSFDDAMRNRTIGQWSNIVNEPRYKIQQLRQNLAQRPAAGRDHSRAPLLKTDWSMDMGSGATVGAGQYPAKFTFATTTASCSDWVAYNTGVAGVSAGQANIVAYSNMYDNTTCTGLGAVPTVQFAYFTGTGKAATSSVLSLDGSKIAFVENPTSGAAVLRILAWHAGQGTPAAAHTPDKEYTNTTAGAGGNTAWNTTNCPTTGSCLISIAFQDGDQDTSSSPFYVYYGTNADTLYVGDSSGKLHKFTGVFNGTPGEVVSATAPIWPVPVSANKLTSPVFDSGTSGNIFVADSGGFLYGVKASTGAIAMTSSKLTYASSAVGIVDGPMVDSSAEKVYVFVGGDANTTTTTGCDPGTAGFGCSGVFQFAAGNATVPTAGTICNPTSATAWPGGTNCGVESVYGTATTGTPTMYDGSFDQIYYATTAGTAGHLWGCAPVAASKPRLSYTTIQASGSLVSTGVVGVATTAIGSLTSAAGTCSPVTEIYGSGGGTTDYIFLSVSANGNVGTINTSPSCTTGCVYNFAVGNGVTLASPTQATEAIASTNGSSGIIIDNALSTTGESQIYFTPLANEPCAGVGGSGAGTGGCAVQTSQTNP